MAPPRVGIGSYVGFAENSGTAYSANQGGTDVSYWHRLAGGADDLTFEKDEVHAENLLKYDQSQFDTFGGQERITGSLTLRPTFGYLQNILRALTGHDVAASGTPNYQYAFVPKDYGSSHFLFNGDTGNGTNWCIEVYKAQGTNSVFYQGCVPTEWSLTLEPNAIAELSMSFIGRDYTIGAKSTPVFKNDPILTTTGQTTNLLTINGSTYSNETVRRVTLTVATPMVNRYGVTDQNTAVPTPDGMREVTLEVEVEQTDDTALNTLNTYAALTGANQVKIEKLGDTTVYLDIDFPAIMLQSPAESRVEDHGVVIATHTYKCLTDGTNPAYNITLQNDDADYV